MTKLRAMRTVRAALSQARAAESEVAGWADEVRREVEARLGIGPDDERAWSDPVYATALDRFGELQAARERIEGALAAMTDGRERPAKEE